MMMLYRRSWLPRVAGGASGLLLAVPHVWPAWAPLQLLALLPILHVAADAGVHRRTALAAGVYMGLAYAVLQALVLRFPAKMMVVLLVHMTVLMAVFAWASTRLLRGHVLSGAFAVGAFLVVLDWASFTFVPFWGMAQSLGRPWWWYLGMVQFVAFTGMTGIIFALATLQALVARFLHEPRRWRSLLTAAALVVLVLLAGNAAAGLTKPVGTLKVAALGWTTDDLDERGGIESLEGFETLLAEPVARCAEQGARLIVSPEKAFYLGDWNRQLMLQQFRETARRNGVFLAIGYFDTTANENRLLFMDPEGVVLADYTKTHLTLSEDYRPGEGRVVTIDLEGVRVGGMICHDDNFTRLSRGLGRERTGVVAVPTLDWLQVKSAHLQSSIRRAIESRYAVVRAAMNGISAIVSPKGELLARRDHFAEGPGIIVADVPVYSRRTVFSLLGHWPIVPALIFLAVYTARRVLGRKAMAGVPLRTASSADRSADS